jgi:hypothetical protein
LAGTLRAVSRHSAELLKELLVAVETVARRGSFDRPLYGAAVRSLGEHGEVRLNPILGQVIERDEAGGLSSLAAACFTNDGLLTAPLSRAAMNRHSILAFAAEVARLTRGESRGEPIAALAPKIKEADRIALCSELFVSLLTRGALPLSIAPALGVLRDAERHLGRWLLLGELATRAGDPKPLAEAREAPLPETRPTVELMARLSDRPSAERDATFLFRMAAAKAPSARPMLEAIARGPTLSDESSVRAALHLCRDYGQERLAISLAQIGKSPRKDALRGLAAAALYDCGRSADALRLARELEGTRHLPAIGWSSLVRAAAAGERSGVLVSESNFRRVQQGSYQ